MCLSLLQEIRSITGSHISDSETEPHRTAVEQRHGLSSNDPPYSAIRRIPVELLQSVFAYLLPEDDSPNLTKAPLLVCHVCSLWRTAAFGDPTLWNRLSLNFSFGNYKAIKSTVTVDQSFMSLSRLWLESTKASPLSLSLNTLNVPKSADVIRAIIPGHSSSFVNLRLQMTPADGNLFLTLAPLRFDKLERLSLSFYPSMLYEGSSITAFESSPLLRWVVLRNLSKKWFEFGTLHRIRFPWAQLTRLDIRDGLPFELWKPLFLECTLLEQCAFFIHFSGMNTVDDARSSLVTSPNLVGMSIHARYHNGASHIGFQQFWFPVLDDLELRFVVIGEPFIHSYRELFRFRSLRRLSLQQCVISIDVMLILLRETTALKELNLWWNIQPSSDPQLDINRVWRALSLYEDSDEIALLAGLEALDLWMWSYKPYYFPVDCLDMIKSRCLQHHCDGPDMVSRATRLKRASIHLHWADSARLDEMKTYLDACIMEGLKVQIDDEQAPGHRSEQWG